MLQRWALWVVWLFIGLGWPGRALAADACSYLLFNPSRYLADESCNSYGATRELETELSPSCVQAARNGTAEASMQRLAALAHSPEHTRGLPCVQARRELAQYTLCRLHPAHHRDWLRAAISPQGWSDFRTDIVAYCLEALLDAGDESALDDAYKSSRPLKTGEALWTEMLETLGLSKSAAVRAQGISRLEWAAQQGLSERLILEDRLCLLHQPESVRERRICQAVRDGETSRLEQALGQRSLDLYGLHHRRCFRVRPESRREEALCSAAAIVIQELSQRAWQRDERQERRLRVGLSALTVLLSGVHLGLTIQYRDHVAGQVLQTMSGIGASVLVERDIMRHYRLNGAADALLSIVVLPPMMALGAGMGYASSLNPASLIVFASTNTVLTAGSVLGLMWTKP